MSTIIRPEISKKNKWWISKHRYYELKHFCLQYPEWREKYIHSIKYPELNSLVSNENLEWNDPTGVSVELMDVYRRKIDLVESSAKEADPDIWGFILLGVTEDLSYVTLKMKYEIPCGRDMYYDRYRKFFHILSRKKQCVE